MNRADSGGGTKKIGVDKFCVFIITTSKYVRALQRESFFFLRIQERPRGLGSVWFMTTTCHVAS